MPNWSNTCPNCPRKYRAIGGDGPRPAPILLIAERPGKDENSYGRVLCGKTGQEFDELYLPLAGLDRSEVRVCNTVLCWADNNKTPSQDVIDKCAGHHIPEEIEKTNPELIILMGASACKLVPGIRLDMQHGIPQPTSKVGTLFGWSGWLLPMYHPSIGLHESRWMKICIDDWIDLEDMLAVGYFESDPDPKPTDYRQAHTRQDVIDYFVGHEVDIPGVDTESHGNAPWSIQASVSSGTGILVRTTDLEAIEELRFWIDGCVMHNASYDMDVLRRVGARTIVAHDTMQEAFHLGNLPQGLKSLTYRLFRHTMTSYEETVRPASISALQTWMLEAIDLAQSDFCFIERVQLKTKVKEVVHKGELESLLTRLLRLTDHESEYDPWERLHDFYHDPANEWMIPIIDSRCGPYPILGIGNCKMADAIRYAVGDADWTARCAVELARRRKEEFKIYAGDKDVCL